MTQPVKDKREIMLSLLLLGPGQRKRTPTLLDSEHIHSTVTTNVPTKPGNMLKCSVKAHILALPHY